MKHSQKLDAMRALVAAAMSAVAQVDDLLERATLDDIAAAEKLGDATHVEDEEGERVTADRWNRSRCFGIVGAVDAAQSSLEVARSLLESIKAINALPGRE